MGFEDWEDVELMASVASGEISALGELVQRHQDKVLGLAYRMLGRWEAAEDVAQDTFVRVYQAAPTYRPQARFTTWLYRIVTNLCLDARRRADRSPVTLGPTSDIPTPETAAASTEANERAQWVRRAVQDLPARQRAVLVLHRYQRLSYAEVAEVTGWSESAVESLLVRAYAALRRRLTKFQEK
ncbi:MAG TPA: sigma-70 family RNA polymerase sigma factor [Planctomycetota bacterium]|nr:sigma-70 family RNA polymerase sigma factor [Planctomycetota bacterium]